MAFGYHGNPVRVHASDIWLAIGVFFLVLGTITTLGEYVFHWWEDPWDWAGPGSLLVGVLSIAWSASSREVRGFHREQREFHREQRADHRQLAEGQERLLAGQAEQTSALREVVASFRQP